MFKAQYRIQKNVAGKFFSERWDGMWVKFLSLDDYKSEAEAIKRTQDAVMASSVSTIAYLDVMGKRLDNK